MTSKPYWLFGAQYEFNGPLYKEVGKVRWFDCYFKKHAHERSLDGNTTISFTNCNGRVKLKVILVNGVLSADTKKLIDFDLHSKNCPFYGSNDSLTDSGQIKTERLDVQMDDELIVLYERCSSADSSPIATGNSFDRSLCKRKLTPNEANESNLKKKIKDFEGLSRLIKTEETGSKDKSREDKSSEDKSSEDKSSEDKSSEDKSRRSGPSEKKANDEEYSDFIESDDDVIMEEEKSEAESDEASDEQKIDWISRYLCRSVTSNADKSLSNSSIFNKFKVLLKAKKQIIAGNDDLVSILICNLVSSAYDIYLHTDHSNFKMNEKNSYRSCLNATILLAVTTDGLKLKPAFIQLTSNQTSIDNTEIELVQSQSQWLDRVFEPELKRNMIDRCVCLTENDSLYFDNEIREKFDQSNYELIVMPNSIAQQISPFQHLVLPILNGHLHQICLEDNEYPKTLDLTIQCLIRAWYRLSEDEIKQAFDPFLNACSD